jgi:hypothetical protein
VNFPGKPKFSPLAILSEQLPTASNPQFVRNAVNRLWCQVMGRGLVHPLDLHHGKNPSTHPAVLDLLATEFAAHQFDIKWLLRELALTRTYQRSSLLPGGIDRAPAPEKYIVAIEKPLSAEQLLWSILQATGELPRLQPATLTRSVSEGTAPPADAPAKPNPQLDDLRKRFLAAFANPPRDPEVDFAPSVKAALFLSNDTRVLELVKPKDGNLTAQLLKESDPAKLTSALFIAILSREPAAEESESITQFLATRPDQRESALSQAAWALITTTEFCVNH